MAHDNFSCIVIERTATALLECFKWARVSLGALLFRQSVLLKGRSLYHADYPVMRYCEAPHLEHLNIIY